MRFHAIFIAAMLAAAGPAASEPETVTQKISFKGCLAAAKTLADEVGVELRRIIDTPNIKLFRIPGSDGTISVTCSAKERTMVLSRTSKRCDTDMAC